MVEERDNMGYPVIVIKSSPPELTETEVHQLIKAKKAEAIQTLTEVTNLIRKYSKQGMTFEEGVVWLEYRTIDGELQITKGYV